MPFRQVAVIMVHRYLMFQEVFRLDPWRRPKNGQIAEIIERCRNQKEEADSRQHNSAYIAPEIPFARNILSPFLKKGDYEDDKQA